VASYQEQCGAFKSCEMQWIREQGDLACAAGGEQVRCAEQTKIVDIYGPNM